MLYTHFLHIRLSPVSPLLSHMHFPYDFHSVVHTGFHTTFIPIPHVTIVYKDRCIVVSTLALTWFSLILTVVVWNPCNHY